MSTPLVITLHDQAGPHALFLADVLGLDDVYEDSLDAAAGLDGHILNPLLSPGTLDDFAVLAVPALADRGLYDPSVKTGTLRSRIFGEGRDRLPPTYPALRVDAT